MKFGVKFIYQVLQNKLFCFVLKGISDQSLIIIGYDEHVGSDALILIF
jgi:hypothetical protein